MSGAGPVEVAARRSDIGGLRALAVILVVADHTFGEPSGGYLGVDIFFVISGFLITGLLLKERSTTGRISIPDFYRRRARRILPAAVLVIFVTAAAAQVLFLANRAHSVAVDGLWSLVFMANWHFALEGADYFGATGPASPFQHYWSLAVEEQFYLIWPALVIACLAVARRRSRRTVVLVVVAVVATLASFGWAVVRTAAEPTTAYFSTFTRAWELGLGAVLALASTRLMSWRGVVLRRVLAWAGLAALLSGAVLLTSRSHVPGPWSAVAVGGAAAIIAAGTGARPPRLAHILDNPVAQYVGLISFSLYLWHWPVDVYLESVMSPGLGRGATALVVAGALSVLSFHLVEDPVRRSTWLEPRRRVDRLPRVQPTLGAGAVRACLASVVVLAAVTTGYSVTGGSSAGALDAAIAAAVVPTDGATAAPDGAEGDLAREVTQALQADTWPTLAPGLDQLGDKALAAPWAKDDCLDVTHDADLARCRYGASSGSKLAVVVGDSVATSYVPGIAAGLGDGGWTVQPLTLEACPASDVKVNDFSGALWKPCVPHRQWVLDTVRRLRPHLVVVASAEDSIDRLASGAKGQAALDEWQQGMTVTLKALRALAPQVVVLGAPPAGLDPRECATPRSVPADCVSRVHQRWWDVRKADQAAVATTGAGTRYVDVHTWFCSSAGYCPIFAAGIPVRADPNHLTDAFSRHLAGVLRETLGSDSASS